MKETFCLLHAEVKSIRWDFCYSVNILKRSREHSLGILKDFLGSLKFALRFGFSYWFITSVPEVFSGHVWFSPLNMLNYLHLTIPQAFPSPYYLFILEYSLIILSILKTFLIHSSLNLTTATSECTHFTSTTSLHENHFCHRYSASCNIHRWLSNIVHVHKQSMLFILFSYVDIVVVATTQPSLNHGRYNCCD